MPSHRKINFSDVTVYLELSNKALCTWTGEYNKERDLEKISSFCLLRWWFFWIFKFSTFKLLLKKTSECCRLQHKIVVQKLGWVRNPCLSLLFLFSSTHTVFDSSQLSIMFIYSSVLERRMHEAYFIASSWRLLWMEDEEMMNCLTKSSWCRSIASRKGLKREWFRLMQTHHSTGNGSHFLAII